MNKRKKIGSLLLSFSGGFFAIYLITLFLQVLISFQNLGPFYSIAGVPVGLKSEREAVLEVEEKWQEYAGKKIAIGENKYQVSSLVKSVNVEESFEEGLRLQKENHLGLSFFRTKNIPLQVTLNDSEISAILSKEYDENNIPAKDAKIVLDNPVRIVDEEGGQTLLLVETKQNIYDAISKMQAKASLKIQEVKPNFTKQEAEKLVARVEKLTNNDLLLESPAGEFRVSKDELASWIKVNSSQVNSLVAAESYVPSQSEQENYVFFDQAKLISFASSLAKKIDRGAVNAQLSIKDGRAGVFVPSQTGYKLDQNDLVDQLLAMTGEKEKLALSVEVSEPAVREETLNNMGIKELISQGWSDFSGSPKNRIHNFTVGASKFNGVLIKPGENFSFNKTLGPVDAANGYLPELVILKDKTVPEYGGGMCQVSSTAFRAALNAGLPIVERTPHAYPVTYYKPYGVDATIYLPKPDLVFQNDTDHYILIQTRIVGTRIYFDFYGTKNNRTVKFSGNSNGIGAVEQVESVNPYLYDKDVRGPNSFTAVFYRHIYDAAGKLTDNDKFTSKYDSPDKYPH